MNGYRLYGEYVIMSLRAEDVYQQLFRTNLRVILDFVRNIIHWNIIQCHCAHHILFFFPFSKKLSCFFLFFVRILGFLFSFFNFSAFFCFFPIFLFFLFFSLLVSIFVCFPHFISFLHFFPIKTHFRII